MTETDPRRRLTDVVRSFVHATVSLDADDETVRAIAGQLEVLVNQLGSGKADQPWYYRPGAEGERRATGYDDSTEAVNRWGAYNPAAPPLRLRIRDGELEGTVTTGNAQCGPPGVVHGGVIALMLDHAMGIYLAAIGRPSMTTSMSVRYLRPTPLHREVTVRARMAAQDGRQTEVEGWVESGDVVTATASGLFLTFGERSPGRPDSSPGGA